MTELTVRAIIRPATPASVHASRRKAVTLRFAKVAAERLASELDLAAETLPLTEIGDGDQQS